MAIFTTGAIENRGREIKSLVVRGANVGTQAADVLLEVFHALNAADGPSVQQLYVQRLVAVGPDQLQTFDNIFSDLDAVTVRVTTSNLGADTVSVSVTARDSQRRLTGLQPSVERIIASPQLAAVRVADNNQTTGILTDNNRTTG
ncbi:hypothetical protein O9H85_14315 [Paenibacillus filicis]|uniref:Uncharacterized protein n=1 Tax=Paenibacillus gyeongsangnamensis TaxID=3388067 RepID=A0ABT4Q9N2_9BACL|nr:hypothetical protein [Paenibacillus filicis]MCZ8513587.1 hypothetical protein [Paenibacillus filicis]